jgi:DNA repair protein RecN (Recombination protein N)
MLTGLRVRDLLLIEAAELAFAPGLNVLTGETGTGKSILLHALGLLLGRRGSPDWIRHGARSLAIEGTFTADGAALRAARQCGIPLEGRELVVTRELRHAGDGRCFVNGQRVLVRVLARLGDQLAEVHGQRDEERFRRAETQRDLLDLYGGHAGLRRRVREAHEACRRAELELARAREQRSHLARDEDWMRFQLDEIARLRPEPGEDETLRARIERLREQAARAEFMTDAEELLNGREGAVLESLEELNHRAQACAGSPDAAEWRAALEDLLQRARSLHRGLRHLVGPAEETEGTLAEAEQRLSELERLRRKHRRPLEEVIALAEELRASLRALAEGERIDAQLREELAARRRELVAAAAELTTRRHSAAGELARALERELAAIEMTNGRFRVALPAHAARPPEGPGDEMPGGPGDQGRADIGPAGGERVEFEIETNPHEGFRPLGEIASGGEMARVALGLRVVLGGRGPERLAVFDEIDAGLGGGAARAVAERLVRVADHRQVLLVTHLPIIAAKAHRHFCVTKQEAGGRMEIEVGPVTGEERIAELARMLSGLPHDRKAREHARSLLGRESGLPEGRGSAKP